MVGSWSGRIVVAFVKAGGGKWTGKAVVMVGRSKVRARPMVCICLVILLRRAVGMVGWV